MLTINRYYQVITIPEPRSFEKILMAIRELEAWKERERVLKSQCKEMTSKKKAEANLKLLKIHKQIRYYESLVADMKREVKPSNLPDLLNALARYYRI